MPVIFFTVPDGMLCERAQSDLVEQASRIFADELGSPIERVRAFVNLHNPRQAAVGGAVNGPPALFFEFIMLKGRPSEQRLSLMKKLSELLADMTGADISTVRGMCRQIDADDWCIAGEPASVARADHVAALARAQS